MNFPVALGRALLVGFFVLAVVAIWTPYHWQGAATALLVGLAGAALLGNAPRKDKPKL